MSPIEIDPFEGDDGEWTEAEERAWLAEEREMLEAALGAGAWEDLCIRRQDPCDRIHAEEDEPLDFG